MEEKVVKNPVRKKYHTCEKCDYTNTRTSNLLSHYLTNHATLEERREKFPHYCRICELGVMATTTYDKHLKSIRHKYNVLKQEKEAQELKKKEDQELKKKEDKIAT